MINIKTNLLKNLTAAFVIVFTVGVSSTWAQEFKSKLPKCVGQFSSNWNDCYGKQNFINGSYEGEFKNALHDGKGIFKLDTGEQYIGGFKSMLKHGYGEYILPQGDKFIGEFKDNQLVKGIAYHADGAKQEGIWKNFKLIRAEKINILELKNNFYDVAVNKKLEINEIASVRNRINNKLPNCVGRYSIQWNNCFGKWNGEVNFAGEMFNNEKQEKYIGQFKNGLKHGKGVFINKKDEEYIGEWKEDLKNGEGIETISGGIIKAIWVNGKKNGKAKLTDKDDKTSVAYFNYEDDELHGEQIYNTKDNELMILNYSHGVVDGLMYGKTETEEIISKFVGGK